MSYILDALRKSEQERRQAEPVVLPATAPADALLRRRFAPTAGVVVLAAGAIGLGAYAMFIAGPQVRPMPAPAPIAAPAQGSAGVPQTGPRPGDEASRTPVETPPAPELKPNPFAARRQPVVRDLAREARVEPPKPRVPAPSRPLPAPAPAANIAPAAPPPAPVKFLRAMPPEFRRALPELVVNIHIYAPLAAERILYINNRQYHAGARVNDDIVVEEIVEDGAVLNYRGQRFKLPRPS